MRRAAALAALGAALWMVPACAQAAGKGNMNLNELVPLYQWIRSGASVCLGTVAAVHAEPSGPGFEWVTVDVAVDEVMWGPKGTPVRRSKFERPASDLARGRFPDPVWAAIDLKTGVRLLLVTHAHDDAPAPANYAQELNAPKDAVLEAVRALLGEERKQAEPRARLVRYLHWLRSGATVQRLFAGEAVVRDSLPGADGTETAEALARAFVSSDSPYAQIALAGWMWDQLYPRTTREGQVAITNATVQVARGPHELSRHYAQDRLVGVGPRGLALDGVRKDAEAAASLRKRAAMEKSTSLHRELLETADALQP